MRRFDPKTMAGTIWPQHVEKPITYYSPANVKEYKAKPQKPKYIFEQFSTYTKDVPLIDC